MSSLTVSRNIDAPVNAVFDTIAHIDRYSQAIPDIIKVELLSDVKSGVGTRFRETRLMNGKKATTELEVTEYVPNDRVRIVTDTHGTVWDTIFVMTSKAGGTELTMTMIANPYGLIAKLTTPMIMGMIGKAIEKDMDAVKAFCEQ